MITEKITLNRYAYEEPASALNSRIDAHKKYSDFDLHRWIQDNFAFQLGDNVIDVGCGNGNYSSLFWEKIGADGTILGFDKNPELIEEARKRHAMLPADHVAFEVGDFDHPFPIPSRLKPALEKKKAQWIFAIYSLYYTAAPSLLVQEVKRHLAPSGSFVVIGPGPENALDLVEINRNLTGNKPNREYFERMERIIKEFKPLFQKSFPPGHVSDHIMESTISFPTAEAYADYYWSTLLWRESIAGFSHEKVEKIKIDTLQLMSSVSLKLKKQFSCVVAKN